MIITASRLVYGDDWLSDTLQVSNWLSVHALVIKMLASGRVPFIQWTLDHARLSQSTNTNTNTPTKNELISFQWTASTNPRNVVIYSGETTLMSLRVLQRFVCKNVVLLIYKFYTWSPFPGIRS